LLLLPEHNDRRRDHVQVRPCRGQEEEEGGHGDHQQGDHPDSHRKVLGHHGRGQRNAHFGKTFRSDILSNVF